MPGQASSASPAAEIAGPATSGKRAPNRSSNPPDQRDSAPRMRVKGRKAAPVSVAE